MSAGANPVALVERYFADVAAVHACGGHAPETSFYPALANLLNGIGASLKPKVTCILQLQNRGAGMPDGGLFTADQLRRRGSAGADDPWSGQLPARGVVEAKAPAEEVLGTVGSDQVGRYWEHYGLVLVTNYRAFALVGRTTAGRPAVLETFALADSEADFWSHAAHPRTAAADHGERLVEYLRRALLHAAPLTGAQDLAALLASYARDARARIEKADLPALAGVRAALEQALGLRFEGAKGEHFFRSTLIQTLFYGVFSAWVLWAKRRRAPPPAESAGDAFRQELHDAASAYGPDPARFDWRSAAWTLRVPMIRALFEQVATPTRLGPLGLVEVLDWTAAALNRVEQAAFFAAFDEGHAVQYFYEPFLEAFDPVLRKQLGVWYTPEEIVDYQVERVDTVLRDELGIPDGLANPRVVVVDSCCGTAAYLRAVLRRIALTLRDRGEDALVGQDLKRAIMERIFGFEILPAPFVIAHLQIGLLLQSLGAPFSDERQERAGIFLTNALTGWEPPKEPKTHLLFPELEEERDAADKVKQQARILVFLGNPPYNGFAGVAVDEERTLTQAYRTVKNVAPPQGQGLNDLYIRFFRMAERKIVEHSGEGIVCFISNYSWLDGLSFTGMRERFLQAFDGIWIDCLNGDKYKTGKLTPEGLSDPSVFSTEFNPEGIQVGTAISLLVKKHTEAGGTAIPSPTVHFRHFWGKDKRAVLVAEAAAFHGETYAEVTPVPELGLSFMPGEVAAAYVRWPTLPELLPVSFPGVQTCRDDFLVAIDRAALEQRLADYFNPDLGHEEIARRYPCAMVDRPKVGTKAVREQLVRRGGPLRNKIVRFHYRPCDIRWLYWEPETDLLDRKREDYFPQVFDGNVTLCAVQQNRKDFDPPITTSVLGCRHLVERGANLFPLLLQPTAREHDLFTASVTLADGPQPNLTPAASAYLHALGLDAEVLFYHIIAALHAPAYRVENAGALRQDWPRIPLPGWNRLVVTPAGVSGERESAEALTTSQELAALLASAALGRQVAALLDTEAPVPGVTCGDIRPDIKPIGAIARVDGKPLNPDAGDLDLAAGWGHAGQGGVTMPGKGRTVLHGEALDVYLNDVACWRNIPLPVWEYTLGGYQVIKKWLSYREKALLGRGLAVTEARYVTEMARRIAALLALQAELDANHRRVTCDG